LEVDDNILLLLGEHSALQSWPQVVDPTQPAALSISLKTYQEANQKQGKQFQA
jgi:hypothetical protein